jgi:hypothetical protein
VGKFVENTEFNGSARLIGYEGWIIGQLNSPSAVVLSSSLNLLDLNDKYLSRARSAPGFFTPRIFFHQISLLVDPNEWQRPAQPLLSAPLMCREAC